MGLQEVGGTWPWKATDLQKRHRSTRFSEMESKGKLIYFIYEFKEPSFWKIRNSYMFLIQFPCFPKRCLGLRGLSKALNDPGLNGSLSQHCFQHQDLLVKSEWLSRSKSHFLPDEAVLCCREKVASPCLLTDQRDQLDPFWSETSKVWSNSTRSSGNGSVTEISSSPLQKLRRCRCKNKREQICASSGFP